MNRKKRIMKLAIHKAGGRRGQHRAAKVRRRASWKIKSCLATYENMSNARINRIRRAKRRAELLSAVVSTLVTEMPDFLRRKGQKKEV